MKKSVLIGFAILLLTAITTIVINLTSNHSTTRQLENILTRLNEIKTASYSYEMSRRQAGETKTSDPLHTFIRMYINPADTIVGAGYSYSYKNDSIRYDGCYDGNYIVQLNWNNKTAQIDSLTDDPTLRPGAPFFIKVKSLIQYALKNSDSSKVTFENFNDTSRISFNFPNKSVTFFRVSPSVKREPEKMTKYELWVDSKNSLPYRLICEMPAQTTIEECTYIKISNKNNVDFFAKNQIPTDFSVILPKKLETIILTELEGQLAPEWKLQEVDGDSVSFKEIKSKVLLLEFTELTCGPCNAALPFLSQLVINNKDKDFELISIEAWRDNMLELHKFKEMNALNYRYLVCEKALRGKYKIEMFPTFFILDKKRVIRKAIIGYIKGETDKELIETIDNLL